MTAVQPTEGVGMPLLGRELLATKGGPIIFTEYTLEEEMLSLPKISQPTLTSPARAPSSRADQARSGRPPAGCSSRTAQRWR